MLTRIPVVAIIIISYLQLNFCSNLDSNDFCKVNKNEHNYNKQHKVGLRLKACSQINVLQGYECSGEICAKSSTECKAYLSTEKNLNAMLIKSFINYVSAKK